MRPIALTILVTLLAWPAVISTVGAVSGYPEPPSGESIDYERAATIKAAYLLHLASLTEWPTATFDNPAEPIRLLVLGPDPNDLAGILSDHTRSLRIEGRPLQVIHDDLSAAVPPSKSSTRRVQDCQMLFITQGAEHDFPPLASALAGRAILTVGESEAFIEDLSGMIGFYIQDGRVRIKTRTALVSGAGLKLSAEFLQHVILVPESGEGG